MSLGVRLMSLGVGLELEEELGDELGHFLVCMREKGARLMSLGVCLLSLGVGLEQEVGDEFGVDFDEFGEFGGHFLVCLREMGCV